MIYRELGFLCGRMIRLLAHPLPPPTPGSKFLSLLMCPQSSLLTEGGEGVGEKPKNTTAKKVLALYKSINTLWTVLTSIFCLASSISFFFSSKTT